MTTSQSLFSPINLGALSLANRLAMAPMTRARAPDRVPNSAMVSYYAQRAGAGLIISEATQISEQGTGSIATPGIHSAGQIAGWRRVTDAVHAGGGLIVCQLWHVGRVSHTSMQPDGQLPVSSSATAGDINTFTANGFEPCTPPRALTIDEIPGVIEQYRQAALNARQAGFDGVQIHAASGYLIDQFLRDGVNRRTDNYGGSVANRARLLLEVTDAVCAAIGGERVSVRLSPFTVTWDCRDSDPASIFSHAVAELDRRELAFLELVERGFDSVAVRTAADGDSDAFSPADLRALYSGALMVNGCYDQDSAARAIDSGYAQAVSLGRPFISTPDVVERYRTGASLNPDLEPIYWYGGGKEGYCDTPALPAHGPGSGVGN
ncbi:alkene reductase [Seongchinamella sediminis]|uniref:Alkene reductase n=1 Tax=Seongchinamella sediminis TaxID=2283635 RepID=A0A3L7E279_9GAMM|nr:alkene reductase [Seongchinamella sediminis]RLQ22830.1 alkene reductase [Seongchinamella sediminis]